MKKAKLEKLVYQQSQKIANLEKENRYLREKFLQTKDFIMTAIAGLIGGSK